MSQNPISELGGVAAISSGASENLSSGHFYWHYFGLIQSGQIPSNLKFQLIGSEQLKSGGAIALFTKRAHQRRFNVGLSTVLDYRFFAARRILHELERANIRMYYIYEGSLADLALMLYLAPRFPRSVFLFNFFWPRHWQALLDRGDWAKDLLAFALRRAPGNICFTADTLKFSNYLASKLDIEFGVFPAFSPYDFRIIKEKVAKKFDFLIVLKRKEELDFAFQVIERVRLGRDLSVAVQCPGTMLNSWQYPHGNSVSVKYFGNDLDRDTYMELLMSANIVFLAYLKDHYEFGSSGKLLDANQARCRLLVPQKTGVMSQAKAMGLAGVEYFDPSDLEGVATTLTNMLENPARVAPSKRSFSIVVDHLAKFQSERALDKARSQRHSDGSWLISASVILAGIFLSWRRFKRLPRPIARSWNRARQFIQFQPRSRI